MRDRNGWGARGWALALVVATWATLASTTAQAASRTVDVENVRVGFQERYKVGTWTPVWITLRGGVEGFAGIMQVVTQDEDGTPTVVSQTVQVAPAGTQRVTAYVRPGSLDPDFATIKFFDPKKGRSAAPEVVIGNMTGSKAPDPLSQNDYQILTIGRPAGVDVIPTLPGFNADKNTAGIPYSRAREVVVSRISALDDLLPGRWYGFDSVDVVVVDTTDKEMLSTLQSPRGEGLRQWVQRGGHLVLAVSSSWQTVNEEPLSQLLPLKLNGQIQVTPFDALESFTGGSHQVSFENAPVMAAKFEDVEARGGKVIASTLSTPLVVRGAYGFGRVTVIGLDIDGKPFSSWPDRGLFFVKALDLKGTNQAVGAPAMVNARIISSYMSDLSTRLRQTLDQFQGVTLIPFAWVAGFIVIYILLIGPGDYFFLKKIIKRMELTWITFPTIVVTISLLAYYTAYMVKGTDLRANKIDVIDIDIENNLSRGVSWVNLFSPQNRDYTIKLNPLMPNKEMPTDPTVDVGSVGIDKLLTWFAAPEAGFRGMNTRGQGMGFGNSGYLYAPMGKADELEGVRIAIWSTKALVSRWYAPAPEAGSVVLSDLQPSGSDRLSGTITNQLPVALKNTIIAYGKQVYYKVGTIEPGQTFDIESSGNRGLDRSLSQHLGEEMNSFLPQNYSGYNENDNGFQGKIRADLIREILFHDSDSASQEVISSRSHRDLDLTGQLGLGRPMLVAEVDRPGTQLMIDGKSGSAKIEQTTILRVILPLKKEAGASKPK